MQSIKSTELLNLNTSIYFLHKTVPTYLRYVFLYNNMYKAVRSHAMKLRTFPFYSFRQPDDGCVVWPKHVAVFFKDKS